MVAILLDGVQALQKRWNLLVHQDLHLHDVARGVNAYEGNKFLKVQQAKTTACLVVLRKGKSKIKVCEVSLARLASGLHREKRASLTQGKSTHDIAQACHGGHTGSSNFCRDCITWTHGYGVIVTTTYCRRADQFIEHSSNCKRV